MDVSLTEAIAGVVVALTGLANAIIYYVIVPFFKTRTTQEQRTLAYGIVQAAVGYAEHIGQVHGIDGASQKRRAVDWIKTQFESAGIAFDQTTVDGWIEDALYDLKHSYIEVFEGERE